MSSNTDVLKADRILVDDRIYRLIPIKDSRKITETNDKPNKPRKNPCFDEDDVDPDLPITHKGDIFVATIHVPEPLLGPILGAKFRNVKALENQYNVKISVPERRNIEAGITIQGSTRKIVGLTYSSIQNKLINNRLKTDSTHFISFPINSTNIQESFIKFQEEVLTKCKGTRGIDASIFQKSTKLHVTVTVLVLLDERDKQNAIAILKKSTDSFLKELDEKEIIVQVRGLEIMNDDDSEVDVLYAKLHELDGDNKLQILANKIMKEFTDANLSKEQYPGVKLHITLMNTIFRDRLEDGSNDAERITFDAKTIMKEYKDYDFGKVAISEIHISIRYTTGPDKYYNSIHKMKLKP